MHNGSGNLRRVHLGNSSYISSHEDFSMPVTRKKAPKSILSLSCQRWTVRFLALRKTSQVLMLIVVISLLFLLPSTVYFMSSLSVKGFKQIKHKKHKRRHGEKANNRGGTKVFDRKMVFPETINFNENNNAIYDKYEIDSDASLKGFDHRHTFSSLQPRIVMLDDLKVVVSSKNGTLALPEEGWRQLRSKYVSLRIKNPTPLSEPETLWKNGCEPIDASWQDAYHPTCNAIHEFSGGWQKLYNMPKTFDDDNDKPSDADADEGRDDLEQMRLINKGAFRHVWMLRDADGITKRAMKTLRSLKRKEKKFDLRNHDRHRRDAMSFEVLNESPLVVDLYASCGNTAIFDYADRGDLLGIFENESDDKSPQELEEWKLHLLKIAYNVSMSVHDAHHFDEHGRATMAHTDIKTDQFIFQDGYYKLSDFNRVRFLSFNPTTKKKCKFTVGKNGGEYRAPEEYAYAEENEKVDVYSLGNVLYFLLTQEEVWDDFDNKKIYELVMAGKRPKFPPQIKESEGIFEKHMMRAIENAWIHRPEDRPGALEVAKILGEGIALKEKSLDTFKSNQ